MIEQENVVREPSPKRPRTDVLKCFADILEEAGVVDCTDDSEVDKYLSELLISFHGSNSFSWWNDNQKSFSSSSITSYVSDISLLLPHRYHLKGFFLEQNKFMTTKEIALLQKGKNSSFH